MYRKGLPLLLILATFFLILPSHHANAQDNVGIGILTPDPSALLHLESTDKGFLPPQMTLIDRDNIAAPADGLIIFNTTDSVVQYWNGVCWLSTFQANCDDCYFNLTSSSIADTIDRVLTDSTQFTLTLSQTSGLPSNIAFAVIGNLPAGMTVTFSSNPLFGGGTNDVTIKVTPFTPAGTYPIIIQALCGGTVVNFVYSVTLTPCYLLDVNNSTTNYDMAVDLSNTYGSAVLNAPVCVVSTVQPGVDVTSPSTNDAAFSTGGLPTGSVAAIVNFGNIIGKGGDGGIATDPANGWTGEGFDGGDAIELTINTTVQNNFNIYGGGGGGNAMAFGLTFDLNTLSPVPLPITLPTIGILIGAGGGGGAGGGAGGNIPTILGLSFYEPGLAGTAGQFGVPGRGGLLLVPINIQQGPVDISINPSAFGGNGGDYGAPGTQGAFNVTLSLSVVVNIPFVGNVTIPILTNFVIPIPVPIPNAGDGGYAIKRNGNNCSIPDNSYNTSFLKGRVGN